MPVDGKELDYDQDLLKRDLSTLRRARAGVSVPGGWTQGQFRSGDRRCAMAWLSDGAGHPALIETARLAERSLLPVLAPAYRQDAGWLDIALFNDHHRTTQEDVVALFDRAIMRLEAHRLFHDFHGSTMTNAPLSAVLTAADQNSSKTRSLA